MKISDIIVDESIYPRSAVDPETIERYREALESGVKLPPLVLMPDNRLIDGRHRLEAHRLLGAETVEAEVEEPADPDARAVELNLRHGRPLSKAELREAARRWYGKKTVTEIAGLLGVTRQTVQNWVADLAAEREETRAEVREQALRMRAEGMTQEEVAERLGVTQQAISKWEYNTVKNLTPLYEETSSCGESRVQTTNCLDEQPASDEPKQTPITSLSEREMPWEEDDREEAGQAPDGVDQESESPEPDIDNENKPLKDYGGRAAAEAFRKKVLPYSDMVKEFFNSIRKTYEIAKQLIDREDELLESVASMQHDGTSISLLANTVIPACETLYFPYISNAKDMLAEIIKPGIKGVLSNEKFKAVKGGKTNGG